MSAPVNLSSPHGAVRESVTAGAVTPANRRAISGERALFVTRVALSVTIMTIGALVMVLVAVPTLFMARRAFQDPDLQLKNPNG